MLLFSYGTNIVISVAIWQWWGTTKTQSSLRWRH